MNASGRRIDRQSRVACAGLMSDQSTKAPYGMSGAGTIAHAADAPDLIRLKQMVEMVLPETRSAECASAPPQSLDKAHAAFYSEFFNSSVVLKGVAV